MNLSLRIANQIARFGTLRQILSFLVVGLVNTFGTYIIYIVLLQFIEYWLAFTITNVVGVVIAVVGNGKFSFRTQPSVKAMFAYGIFFVCYYIISMAMVVQMVRIHVSHELAPLIAVVVLLPFSFVCTRYAISGRFLNKDEDHPNEDSILRRIAGDT
ncbi:MAG: GtrA family protein [Nitrospirae bacterium]|nr:GtrA family protein [Magnetococcales bacterium]